MMLLLATSWLFPAAAWTLLGGGGLLAAWALFWDRPRGRRRCPKCWYDMAGVPGLKCPECGREAKRERCLRKTRRRWRWVAFAALIAIPSGEGLRRASELRERGWPAAAPTTVLLFSMRWFDPPTPVARVSAALGNPLALPARARLYDELFEVRLHRNQLWSWQRRWLIERCATGDRRRPLASESWRQTYAEVLRRLHAAGEQARHHPDGSKGRSPYMLSNSQVVISDRELARVREGLSIASIRTRRQWPVGVPILAEIQGDYFMAMENYRRLIVQAGLTESAPVGSVVPMFGFGYRGNMRLINDTWILGIAQEPERFITLEVRLADEEMRLIGLEFGEGSISTFATPVFETSIRYPSVVGGSIDDIMSAESPEELTSLLRTHFRPLCTHWEAGRMYIHLFARPRDDELADRLAEGYRPYADITIGVRVEIRRAGQLVATGQACVPVDSAGRSYGDSPRQLRLEARLADGFLPDRKVGTHDWTVRIIGDPVVALRDFDSSRYWMGELEAPLEWDLESWRNWR